LQGEGFSTRAIAMKLGKGRSTVSRLLKQAGERKQRGSQLESFVPYLRQRALAGMTNKMQLYRELLTLGFTGSYGSVYSYFAAQGAGLEEAMPLASSTSDLAKQRTYRPCEARRLFTQDPAAQRPDD
jgi:transposase